MLCDKCYKYQTIKPFNDCAFCLRLNLSEEVLCWITRDGSEHGELSECGAYRPKLSIVSPKQHNLISIDNKEADSSGLTDKDKWFVAYSKQQLLKNPEQNQFKLQFHLCVVARKRNRIFSNSTEYFDKITSIFQQIVISFENTQIEVLWICSDHIHLYLNTSPDYSLDKIVDKLIEGSTEIIGAWERAYFAETIG